MTLGTNIDESIFKERTKSKPCIIDETSMEQDKGVKARRYGEQVIQLWCLEGTLK